MRHENLEGCEGIAEVLKRTSYHIVSWISWLRTAAYISTAKLLFLLLILYIRDEVYYRVPARIGSSKESLRQIVTMTKTVV